MGAKSESVAKACAGVLLYLLSNYWHTIGVGVPEAEKLMARIDAALLAERDAAATPKGGAK